MEIKIYRDGKYDIKANIRLKARNLIHKQISAIDAFFESY